MPKPLTADEILPLVKHLTLMERERLVNSSPQGDVEAYGLLPPKPDEFSSDDEDLAWDGEGWEKLV
jgi:hypothetical protein